jgi:hypothetical protein
LGCGVEQVQVPGLVEDAAFRVNVDLPDHGQDGSGVTVEGLDAVAKHVGVIEVVMTDPLEVLAAGQVEHPIVIPDHAAVHGLRW